MALDLRPAVPAVARLAAFALAVMLGSAAGSLLTLTSDVWVDADPLTASLVGLASLGGAIAVLAAAPMRPAGVALASGGLFAAMVAMWSAFVSNESSTSALVFILGWLIGLPVAGLVTWSCLVRSTRRTQ